MNRRGLLTGLGGIILTAPAIVRASSLMAIKAYDAPRLDAVLISLVRKYVNSPEFMRKLIEDIIGVQPMTGPTDALFNVPWSMGHKLKRKEFNEVDCLV